MSKKQKGAIIVPGAIVKPAPSQTTKNNKPASSKHAFLKPCELGSPWPDLEPEDWSIEAYSDSLWQPLGTQRRFRLRVSASRRMLWILLLVMAVGGYAAARDRNFFQTISNWLVRTLH
ncbi:MAG TPA: hypothetical protein VK699_16905 [Terriglobales bacterium]|jgi:hypothetical protein|nr:hypothetical protein [Terriglobales bacterium]